MDEKSAKIFLEETFKAEFNAKNFYKFINELLNDFDLIEREWNVWKEYTEYIDSYKSLGTYKDPKGNLMEVLTVKLKRTESVDRARTMQRNFVAKFLANAEKDAALVAFYGDDPQDWRFSFVKMDYQLQKSDSGKMRAVENLTPAKRYSFLVGKNEPNHTCQSQFLKLLKEETTNPSLEEIENAFSIDNVTKEFFNLYKELYIELKESIEKMIEREKFIKREFEEKGISPSDFSKKLLGQIVFIYFLQKKGWLGVVKDQNGVFKNWGTGPKDFLKTLFKKHIINYENFFNDVLEPLFYEALATQRDNDYYSRFKCKIPFLNGGLFEPMNDYDWSGTEMLIENRIIENILNTFDRFNFTVKEDEPLEKEVAIDPEMLGKVFENLLEVEDRKSTGSYYTPREIVYYMCQQSLMNYLETNTSIPRKDIELFIRLGESLNMEDERYLQEIGKLNDEIISGGKRNIGTIQNEIAEKIKQLKLPISIVKEKDKIDNLLKEIKIVDPAVGSGAFLVGMMNEIVKARQIISVYYPAEEYGKRKMYDLKRETIENSLYGVDIDSSATDIAKLRLWLSLIVDEIDMKNIKPLPNLDHKIMCGNSLLEEFEGIKLFDDKLLGFNGKDKSEELRKIEDGMNKFYRELGEIHRGQKRDSGQSEVIEKELKKLERRRQELVNGSRENGKDAKLSDLSNLIKESKKKLIELKELQRLYFNEQNRILKKKYFESIDKIEWELIESTLKEQGNEKAIKKLMQYRKNKSKPFFLWKLYFSEVFQRENPGFDVVIANPPYIRQEEIMNYKKYLESRYEVYSPRSDLYTYFYERGIHLIRQCGILTFISSNKFMRAKYGNLLRDYLKNKTKILRIVDFGHVHVFEAITNTSIIIIKKEIVKNNIFYFSDWIYSKEYEYEQKNLMTDAWTLANEKTLKLKNKIENNGTPLSQWSIKISYGVKAGYNEAFVFDSSIKNNFIKKNSRLNDIIKPLLRGRDIGRYVTKFSDKWILISKYDGHEELMKKYPEAVDYLKRYEKQLKNRGQVKNGQHHWLELDNNPAENYIKLFDKEKIVWIELSDKNKFAYSDGGEFILAGAFMITGTSLKYLLSFLNSNLCLFYFNLICNSSGMDTTQWKKFVLERMPVKKISANEEKIFIQLVDQILSLTKSKDYLKDIYKQTKVNKFEKEIDKLFYKLYELTPEEIKIVEDFCEKNE